MKRTPRERLDRVLRRLSRDRWLSPARIHAVLDAFDRRVHPSRKSYIPRVPKHFPEAAFVWGLIRGWPVRYDDALNSDGFCAEPRNYALQWGLKRFNTLAVDRTCRPEMLILLHEAGQLGKKEIAWLLK